MTWPMVKLETLVQKVSSWNPSTSVEDIDFLYIDLSSVDKDQKKINAKDVKNISAAMAPSRARQLVKENDVLIATVRPNLNGVALVTADFDGATASTGYCVLRANKNKLDERYLFYWVQSVHFIRDMISKATGANYPAVSDKIIFDSKIPLPPLAEQKRIAAILDKADAIRQKRQQAIALADDFLRSVFLDMFGDPVTNLKGWDKRPLHEIASHIVDCPHSTPRWTDDGIIALRTSNLTKGGWDWTDKRFVSELEYKERTKRSELVAKDLILSREGTVGIAALVPEGVKMCMGQRLVQIRVNNNYILPEYLLYLILIELEPDRISRLMTGSTSKHINVSDLKSLSIMLPPLAIQNEFVETMTFLNSIKERLALFDVDSNMAFDAISQKAFSGQL